jgi:hypothetical protein
MSVDSSPYFMYEKSTLSPITFSSDDTFSSVDTHQNPLFTDCQYHVFSKIYLANDLLIIVILPLIVTNLFSVLEQTAFHFTL